METGSAALFGPLAGARLPRHVAVIMDGNGRWATRQGLERTKGHARGVESLRAVVRTCRKLEIPYLTVYAFSLENWNRPRPEIELLLRLLRRVLKNETAKLDKYEIRLTAIGDRGKLPADVRELLAGVEAQTRDHRAMTLVIALSYSSRDEIVRAARRLAERAQAGELAPAAIDERLFAAQLDTAGIPDPDLLIRTSGEQRLSNYLLWQSAYAELYLTPVLWPDFGEAELVAALVEYARRERRFGRTGEQLHATAATGGEEG